MNELLKIAARQDTDFKLSPSSSNETSINLSNELSSFISEESGAVSFTIFKEDFVKAIGALCLIPKIYQYKNQEPSNPCDIFFALSQQIVNQFGELESTSYKVNILKRDDGRAYLNALKQSNGFNVRSFLVERFSVLRFIKDEQGLSLRLITRIPEDEVEKTHFDDLSGFDFAGPLQQIFFGAPGTGKSHEINKVCCKYQHFRTTFHPDTDYASFVGAYKPITIKHPVYGAQGQPSRDAEGNVLMEDRIVYRYVAQAFLKAYVAAWKEQQEETPAPVFLVIEEINRGNCAQIFGDIFQLLDRNESGFSDYPIVADDDLALELKKVFEDLEIVNADEINNLYKGGQDVVAWVKSGSHLLLPNNLYIWATMNTSDQSLFPIDSAFKRRWDWKYIKIKNSSKNYRIVFSNGNEYDWWEFLSAINDRIESGDIQQEDKKLGYFFVKAKEDGIVSAEMLLSKVIFYLYNDVFKDFGFEEDFFKDEAGRVMTFASYFDPKGEVDESRVERFITNVLDLDVSDYPSDSTAEDSLSHGNDGGRDRTKFRINGKGELVGKNQVAVELVKTYVSQHPELNASEIIGVWKPFEKFVSHFMESEEEYNQRVNIEGKQPRAEKIDCGGGGSVYVATNGYGTLEKMRRLQTLLKEADLGLEISSEKNETAD